MCKNEAIVKFDGIKEKPKSKILSLVWASCFTKIYSSELTPCTCWIHFNTPQTSQSKTHSHLFRALREFSRCTFLLLRIVQLFAQCKERLKHDIWLVHLMRETGCLALRRLFTRNVSLWLYVSVLSDSHDSPNLMRYGHPDNIKQEQIHQPVWVCHLR